MGSLDTPSPRRDRLVEIGVVLAAVAVAAASASPYHCGANDASRLATVESLVDYHTLAIDQSRWFQDAACDKIRPAPGGPYYSDKPPTLALMLAVPYLALHDGFGIRAVEHEAVFYYLSALLSSGLAYVAAAWCVYRLGRILGLAPGWAAGLTASFALATVALAYSRNVNSHLPTLAAALGVLLNLAALGRPGRAIGRLLLLGALAGFAYALEQPTGGLLLAAAAVVAAVRLRRPTAIVWVALAALPWAVVHHVVTNSYAGTLGPANANPAFFDYPGSAFDAHNLTGRWNHADVGAFAVYAVQMLFSDRGFVTSNPTLLLALPAAAWALRPSSGWHAFAAVPRPDAPSPSGKGRESMPPCLDSRRVETICFGLWGLGVWLLYAALSTNFAGTCCTIRWFVPLLAPAYFWLALLLRDHPEYRIDFVVLSGWGAVLAGYFWVGGPFGTFYDRGAWPYFDCFFWSVLAAALLTWAACRVLAARRAARRR